MLTPRSLVFAVSLTVGCAADPPKMAACLDGSGWSSAPPVLGGAIQETAVVALDGKVYVLGGFNGSVGVVASVRIYDAATCTWSDGPALPRAVHHVNAAVAGDTLYVVGGLEGNFIPIGDVWAWNPSVDSGWTVRASMPVVSEHRGAAVTGVIDGRIYVAGGLRGTTEATLSAYSIAEDRWETSLPPLPEGRDHACGGVVGGKLYVVGGRFAGNSPLVFEYTPGGAWSQKAAMPTARSGIACGVDGDRIVAVGGELNPNAATNVFSQVEVYTVSLDRWESLDPMPTPRHGTGAAVVDGVLYVPGGAIVQGFAAVDTHEALEL
jgi:N-acetylneuraminic acid mutarotase